MRTIKFRLRSCVDKIVGYEKWYIGTMDSKNFYIAKPRWLYSRDGKKWDPERINHRLKDQYTGLKDKNGKEIFESDIVKDGEYILTVMVDTSHGLRFTLEMNTKKQSYYEQIDYEQSRRLEIIGNIYENKKLLRQKQLIPSWQEVKNQ